MHHEEVFVDDNSKSDFAHSWVSSSRFLFLCQVFLFISFVAGCSFSLYKHTYKGKPEVKVTSNTLYNPTYK